MDNASPRLARCSETIINVEELDCVKINLIELGEYYFEKMAHSFEFCQQNSQTELVLKAFR